MRDDIDGRDLNVLELGLDPACDDCRAWGIERYEIEHDLRALRRWRECVQLHLDRNHTKGRARE